MYPTQFQYLNSRVSLRSLQSLRRVNLKKTLDEMEELREMRVDGLVQMDQLEVGWDWENFH